MLGCVVGGAGTGLWVKFDFGSARSTVVRDRPDLGYNSTNPQFGIEYSNIWIRSNKNAVH